MCALRMRGSTLRSPSPERFERRDVERVERVGGLLNEVADRRKEAGEGLSRARGRDQQGVAAATGDLEHFELVPARPPAACRKPLLDLLR